MLSTRPGDVCADGLPRSVPCAMIADLPLVNGWLAMTLTLDAKSPATPPQEFDVEDVEYLRHGDKPLLARVFKPQGAGPFPALVEVHGGAWCQSDRLTERLRH
jgi:acetyl esterase/lipase